MAATTARFHGVRPPSGLGGPPSVRWGVPYRRPGDVTGLDVRPGCLPGPILAFRPTSAVPMSDDIAPAGAREVGKTPGDPGGGPAKPGG